MKQDSEYIPLSQAEKYCSYSADYLKLRARQGKLKAKKMGRIWVTKKEWVEEYDRKMEEYKGSRTAIKGKAGKDTKIYQINLPKWRLPKKRLSIPSSDFFRILFLSLGAILLITIIVLEKTPINLFYQNINSSLSQRIYLKQNQGFQRILQFFRDLTLASTEEVSHFTISVFREYFDWLKQDFVEELLGLSYNVLPGGLIEGSQELITDLKYMFQEGIFALKNHFEATGQAFFSLFRDRKAGIMLYDKATDEPYCVSIENGQITILEGKCR